METPAVPGAARPGVDPALDVRGGGVHALVIGHRGASGYRPEHTLASYELAARMGADHIEPDVVVTRDGVLVCRHEPEIGGTTDVAARPEFAARRATRDLDGRPVTGWWVEDFTLAELRTLRAVERLPAVRPDNTMFDGRFVVPTLQEVLDLRRHLSRVLGRTVGIYPETKHPTYFRRAGLPLEDRLLDLLRADGMNHPGAPVFVQSFETTNLRHLRAAGLRTRVVQLVEDAGAPYDLAVAGDRRTYDDLVTPAGLRAIANYADAIGPDKHRILPVGPDGRLGAPTSLVADAHDAGLLVHAFTFRAENAFLPEGLRRGSGTTVFGDALAEQHAFLAAGVDGLFTDQPDVTVLARSLFGARQPELVH